MKKITCLFFILLFACGDSKTSSEDQQKPEIDTLKTEEKLVEREKIPEDLKFHRQYVGKLGEEDFVLHLTKIGKQLLGTYYLERKGEPQQLLEGKIGEYGDFSFSAYTGPKKKERLSATLTGDNIEGFWEIGTNQKIPLSLQLYTGSGQVLFDVFHDSKVSWLVKNNTASPKHIFIQTLLYPSFAYKGVARQMVYELFNDLYKGHLVQGNPYGTIENMWKEALKQYREANLEIYQVDPSYASSMNWSEVAHMEVAYNQNNILSLRQSWYNYTGGAHGNTGVNYIVMDVEKGMRIRLNQVIQPRKHAAFSTVIKQFVAKQRQLRSVADLASSGIDPTELKPIENFYLTHKGIGFHFPAHQIGGYALDDISVFIPFTACNDFLTNEFKTNEI